MMTRRYTAVVVKEDRRFVAYCVGPGVVSQGKTIEAAQVNLKDAVKLSLESFGSEDLPESKGEVILYPLEVIRD